MLSAVKLCLPEYVNATVAASLTSASACCCLQRLLESTNPKANCQLQQLLQSLPGILPAFKVQQLPEWVRQNMGASSGIGSCAAHGGSIGSSNRLAAVDSVGCPETPPAVQLRRPAAADVADGQKPSTAGRCGSNSSSSSRTGRSPTRTAEASRQLPVYVTPLSAVFGSKQQLHTGQGSSTAPAKQHLAAVGDLHQPGTPSAKPAAASTAAMTAQDRSNNSSSSSSSHHGRQPSPTAALELPGYPIKPVCYRLGAVRSGTKYGSSHGSSSSCSSRNSSIGGVTRPPWGSGVGRCCSASSTKGCEGRCCGVNSRLGCAGPNVNKGHQGCSSSSTHDSAEQIKQEDSCQSCLPELQRSPSPESRSQSAADALAAAAARDGSSLCSVRQPLEIHSPRLTALKDAAGVSAAAHAPDQSASSSTRGAHGSNSDKAILQHRIQQMLAAKQDDSNMSLLISLSDGGRQQQLEQKQQKQQQQQMEQRELQQFMEIEQQVGLAEALEEPNPAEMDKQATATGKDWEEAGEQQQQQQQQEAYQLTEGFATAFNTAAPPASSALDIVPGSPRPGSILLASHPIQM